MIKLRSKMIVGLCVASFGALPGYAFAACTQQDALSKAQTLSQLLQTKMAKDPAGTQALMVKMQPIAQSYSTQMGTGAAVNWDTVCTAYDDLLKQAQ